MNLSVVYTGKVGRTCTVGASVTTADGQVKGLRVEIQKRSAKGRWVKLANVTSKRTTLAKAGLKTVEPVTFRAVFAGTDEIAGDVSNRVTCKPVALTVGSKSASVKKLQKKLKKLRDPPGQHDAARSTRTRCRPCTRSRSPPGMPRTGVVTSKVYAKVMKTKRMKAPSWCGDATTMCIDISQQVGYLKVGTSTKSAQEPLRRPGLLGRALLVLQQADRAAGVRADPDRQVPGVPARSPVRPTARSAPTSGCRSSRVATASTAATACRPVRRRTAASGFPARVEQWVYGQAPGRCRGARPPLAAFGC